MWYIPGMNAEGESLVSGVRSALTDEHRQLMEDINAALNKGDQDERIEDVRTGHSGGEARVQSRGSASK
jgi:hypothetical protein